MMKEFSVLIVDDDEVIRQELRKEFRESGFRVYEAADGEAGLAEWKERVPDIIILDVVMPKLDGLSMLKAINEQKKKKTPVIIVLTQLDDNEDLNRRLRAFKDGAVLYFIKRREVTMKELVERAIDLLGVTPHAHHAR
jgi:phosphoserine phosphatase RsbU/P